MFNILDYKTPHIDYSKIKLTRHAPCPDSGHNSPLNRFDFSTMIRRAGKRLLFVVNPLH